MPLITWNDTLSVKITKFDEEHKELVKMINNLHDTVTYAQGFEVVSRTLKELVNYTQTHFKHEEEFLQKCNYSELEAHKEEHRKFVAKITMLWCAITLSSNDVDRGFVEQIFDFQRKYSRELNSSAAYLQDLLGSWLVNHVRKADMKYGAALHGKQP
ncbi:MAG: bacteriohemerythrin [Deferribacteraceae bacterium]|jgi:hemerythrin-like metal-binding protein|nr:bacteriohemerythrin [Deferribacteraceae bacterium]